MYEFFKKLSIVSKLLSIFIIVTLFISAYQQFYISVTQEKYYEVSTDYYNIGRPILSKIPKKIVKNLNVSYTIYLVTPKEMNGFGGFLGYNEYYCFQKDFRNKDLEDLINSNCKSANVDEGSYNSGTISLLKELDTLSKVTYQNLEAIKNSIFYKIGKLSYEYISYPAEGLLYSFWVFILLVAIEGLLFFVRKK